MKYMEYTDLVAALELRSKRVSYMARALGFDPDKIAKIRANEYKMKKVTPSRGSRLEDRMVREMILASIAVTPRHVFANAVAVSTEEGLAMIKRGLSVSEEAVFKQITKDAKDDASAIDMITSVFPEKASTWAISKLIPHLPSKGKYKEFLKKEKNTFSELERMLSFLFDTKKMTKGQISTQRKKIYEESCLKRFFKNYRAMSQFFYGHHTGAAPVTELPSIEKPTACLKEWCKKQPHGCKGENNG